MRKFYSLLLLVMLLPMVAFAQNKAVQKTRNSGVSASNRTETRFIAPVTALGYETGVAITALDYSVGMWLNVSEVNTTVQPKTGVIFRFGTDNHANTNGAANLHSNGSGALTLNFGADNNTNVASFSVGSIAFNQWQHIMLVFDSTNDNVRVYINGNETLNNNTLTEFGYKWGDGVFQFLPQCITAKLDELQFFNKALSATEVAAAYGNAAKVDGLTSLYTFDTVKSGTTSQFESVAGSISGAVAKFQQCTWGAFWAGDGLVNLNQGTQAETAPSLVDGREIALEEYTVNIASSNPEAGSVAFTNPASSGNSLSTTVPTVTVTATANLGWRFTNWTDGSSNIVSTNASYTYAGAADISLTANFEAISVYTVTIEQPAQGGSVAVSANGNAITSGTQVNAGTVLTLSNSPAGGFTFLNYLVDGNVFNNTEYTVSHDVTISAEFEEGIDYCAPTPVAGRSITEGKTNYTDRGINTLTIADSNSSISLDGPGTSGLRDVYIDYSSTILVSEAGETVTLTAAGSGSWMNTFVYVDWGLNGLTESDRVYSNFDGSSKDYAITTQIPIAADVTPGKYRVRYIVDWDQASGPCYYGQSGKDNGEVVLDFTIQIPGPPTINYRVSGGGDVVVADEFTHEGTGGFHVHSVVENGSEIEKEMLLIFVPKQYKGEVNTIAEASINGSDIIGLLVSGSYLDYESKDLPGTSDAACYWMTIPATQTEDQNVYVRFEGAVQGIDGIGMEESKGPAEYYNLQGVRVSADNLVPGFYIVRQGGKATKVFIQK